ncbi:MAG: hypothetical protein ABII82_08200 [Verrucomicrobiota bacterium]
MSLKRRIFFFSLGLVVLLVVAEGVSTWRQLRTGRNQVRRVHEAVRIGDDIHAVRRALIAAGFYVYPVDFPTAARDRLTCVVKLRNHDLLDGYEYALGLLLRPWRRGIPYHVLITATPEGAITKREP